MTRICYGEFDYPEGQPEDRIAGRTGRTAYLQNEFLKAIHGHAPEVWEDLYNLRKLTLPIDAAWLSWPNIRLKRVDKQLLRSVEALEAALHEWAQRWNLNAEWCLQGAYDALRWWTRHGRLDNVLWAGANWGGAANPPNAPPPPNGIPEYRPLFMFRETYLQGFRSSGPRHGALKLARTYCAQVDDYYEQAGYSRCKADEKRNLDQHLEWTVRFQVRRESLEDIGNAGIEPSTVLRGVYDLLRLIYLSKRADAVRGRRYGSKNKRNLKELGR